MIQLQKASMLSAHRGLANVDAASLDSLPRSSFTPAVFFHLAMPRSHHWLFFFFSLIFFLGSSRPECKQEKVTNYYFTDKDLSDEDRHRKNSMYRVPVSLGVLDPSYCSQRRLSCHLAKICRAVVHIIRLSMRNKDFSQSSQ
jgi:hypothetical protein